MPGDHFIHILVTGANGQLGMEFREMADRFPQIRWFFTGQEDLTITNATAVTEYCRQHQIQYIINCAAYTAVDLAEQETDKAFQVNAEGPAILAGICREFGIRLIHISTDYVFRGNAEQPYHEEDLTDPLNVYGASKLLGEERIMQIAPDLSVIIRTSWVFGKYGKNFVKTMLRLMKEKDQIKVVNDQQGCPTYAADLAGAIMQIILFEPNKSSGIYHYCNEGITNWFEFASTIRTLTGSHCQVDPISTKDYPTPAKRPSYSVLDTSLIKSTFQLSIPHWKKSLIACLERLH